jgi:hypothetical protein
MSTNIKYCFLCFSLIIIVNSIFAQNKNERIYSFEPSYNRGGLFYNGFRLKSKESVYTNTFVLLNNVGFGIGNILELNGALSVVPIGGSGGAGFLPLFMLIPRAGFDLGRLHHFSGSVIFLPFNISSQKQSFANKQLVYTFGIPKYNIGLLFSKDEVINQDCNFLYLQSSFFIFKRLKIGTEHIIYTNFNEIKGTEYVYSFYNKPDSEYLIPTNLIFRYLLSDKSTLNIGYFTQYLKREKQILYLSLNIKLNKK